MVKNLPANAGDIRDAASTPGLGRSPGGGHADPLQYSCLENPMDRGWWSTGSHRVGHNWSDLTHSTHTEGFISKVSLEELLHLDHINNWKSYLIYLPAHIFLFILIHLTSFQKGFETSPKNISIITTWICCDICWNIWLERGHEFVGIFGWNICWTI